jgi:hypothetical protein
MAAYIDLNAVRAGVWSRIRGSYRFCGYVEAVAAVVEASQGLIRVWSDHGSKLIDAALRLHRSLIFG